MRTEFRGGWMELASGPDASSDVRVLIIDDDPGSASLARAALEQASLPVHVQWVARLSAGLEAANGADCVLLDLGLPDTTGLDGVSRLIAHAPGVPIVMLTGKNDEGIAVAAVQLGVQDYICKDDLSPEVLARSVRYAVERSRLLVAVEQREAHYRGVVEALGEGVVVQDLRGSVLSINATATRMLGIDERSVLGHSLAAMSDGPRSFDGAPLSLDELGWRALVKGQPVLGVTGTATGADGGCRSLEMSAYPLSRPDGGESYGVVIVLRDVTDRRRAEEALAEQALRDSMTGLPNRHLLQDRLAQGLTRVRHSGQWLSLMVLDIDRFGLVNDGMGHAAGDAVLLEVARRVSSVLGTADTAARLGGDEFAIVCEGQATASDSFSVAQRVLDTFAEPFWLAGQDVYLSASIGVALASGQTPAQHLLRNAGNALHRAKEQGGGRIELFNARYRAQATHRLEIETALRKAVDNGGLRLAYQPVVDLVSGVPVSVEALLRWDDPVLGPVTPDTFIPIAEQTGLIVPLGEWVIEEATGQLSQWHQDHPQLRTLHVSVNVSARQFASASLFDAVRSARDAAVFPPSALQLEITESVLMDDVEQSAANLAALKALGVTLAVDDFGTGYSSLSYLKRFPIDLLKIDRSFVDGLGVSHNDSTIVEVILGLGRGLGVRVLAEGVETADQRARLQALGCELAQGFLWSQALPPDEARGWLLAASAARA